MGATYPEMSKILRKLMPHTYFLVPGYGAQGGTAEDLKILLQRGRTGRDRSILPAASSRHTRQDAYAKFGPEHFADASQTGCHRYDCGHRTAYCKEEAHGTEVKRQQLYIVRKNWHLAFSVCGLVTDIADEARSGTVYLGLQPGRFQTSSASRSVSVEADPDEGRLRIVYRIAGKGTDEFSKYVSGDPIDIMGPLGNGFPSE